MLTLARRGVSGLLGFALATVLIIMAGIGLLAWRLNERPLDITWLAKRAERHFTPAGTTVVLQQATIAWTGFRTGLGASLDVAVAGLDVTAPGQDNPVSIAHADAELSMGRLLTGQLVPRSIVLSDVRLHLRRAADGSVGIDVGGPDEASTPTIADAARRPQSDSGTSASPLAQLRRVSVHGLQADITDAQLGAPWQAREVTIELNRLTKGGVTGSGTATLSAGGVSTRVDAAAELTEDAGATRIRATATPVSPAALARALPGLSSLAALDAPVTATLTADFGAGFALLHAAAHASAGAGTAFLPTNAGTSPAAFTSIALEADGNRSGGTLKQLTLVLPSPSGGEPTTLGASGTLTLANGRLRAPLTVTLDHASFADLPKLWPAGVGGGARAWLAENITAGSAHDGRFNLTLEAAADLSGLDLTDAGGTMAADDLTVWWLRPVPPLDHGHATLTLLSRDALEVAATARDGAIQLPRGTIRITGLAAQDQAGVINADLASPLADLLTLLKHPRLQLLSAHPVPLNQPGGAMTGHLTVRLPLDDKVDIDAVAIHALAKVADAHLGGVIAGRSLDHGALTVDVTNDALKLTGSADLAGLPSDLALTMDFRNGPAAQIVQHAAVSLHGTDQQLAAAGLDTAGVVTGLVAAQVDYSERRDGQAAVQLDATLNDAGITTPLGWSKPAGVPGTAHARAVIDHGRLTGIEDLRADAPGLVVQSRTDIVNGQPSVLHLQQVVIGRTRGTGEIRFPQHDGEAFKATLTGSLLDLSGRTNAKPRDAQSTASQAGPPQASGTRPPATPYVVNLRFDHVMLGPDAAIGPVSLDAEGAGTRVARVRLTSSGPEQLRASVTPAGPERRLVANVGDLGSLLKGLAVTRDINGGAMSFTGAFDDRVPSGPLSGVMAIDTFKIGGTASLLKLLQGITIYGLVDALRGPGLVFDRLTAPIRLADNVLTIENAHAYSSSLGVTAQGVVDFGSSITDVKGTIVPAYLINTLPGRIPLIGSLFSPERGGGVFATTYRVHGPFNNLSVGVNPLATLTPGFLRGLFGVFDRK